MATAPGALVAAEKAAAPPVQGGDFEINEVVYVRKHVTSENWYEVLSLQETVNESGSSFNLLHHRVPEASGQYAKDVFDELLITTIPEYLRNAPSRKVHVVVSTGSGTGLALDFYQYALKPLLKSLGLSSEDTELGSNQDAYALTITQDSHSIRRFARDLSISSNGLNDKILQHTIILLSGDGGTIELLNGKAPGDTIDDLDVSQPLIATLPLGTGNALFHSLHKPLYPDSDETNGPTPLVLGLRTLLRGRPKPLPSFEVNFSPGSRTITYSKLDDNNTNVPPDSNDNFKEQFDTISHLHGAIVASYGFHSQLVWESDTPEYRKHGSNRFQMVAAELLKENHEYNASVEIVSRDGSTQSQLDREKHAYILATLVSNLEKTFTISPASRPLDGQLRLVHFGPVPAKKVMDIMIQAYNNGKHVDMEWEGTKGETEKVGYVDVQDVKVTTHEKDARWRKVCIDGTIVEIPEGGSMAVTTETKHHLQVLAPWL
ncbi:ATP-NAD kinase-like domain-containing protein [Truncatella angustata]|uniref:ATP-NAD kinase-like domain-containing protein n=1 Tax=Truncatella angustata TaxID=152316 RepID=A0A9P8UWX0_9PEZI|nr:ATP-NAD kinase-like domain-containing protein [Truncatella angustata]KAH6659847.1 ATP-NAD kinase-like domain-containing protein [Truncatella angustata]